MLSSFVKFFEDKKTFHSEKQHEKYEQKHFTYRGMECEDLEN